MDGLGKGEMGVGIDMTIACSSILIVASFSFPLLLNSAASLSFSYLFSTANRDDPEARRTVYDMYNDRDVVLTERDLEIIRWVGLLSSYSACCSSFYLLF